MPASDRRPAVRAPEDRWQRLGELLQLRRGELGYRRRPAFTRERDINIRLVTDIENAYRPNTFLTPTLREIAQAYAVTYESLIAVLNGKEELTPAPPAAAPGLPPPPQSELVRDDAVRPYADPLWVKLIELRDQGVIDPDGARLGLTSFYAKVWDDSAGKMVLSDRVWLVGTVLRNAAAWSEGREQDATSA